MSTIVIVGAGPLLGMGLAKKFGREGFAVALVARRQEALDEYVAAVKGKPTVEGALRAFLDTDLDL